MPWYTLLYLLAAVGVFCNLCFSWSVFIILWGRMAGIFLMQQLQGHLSCFIGSLYSYYFFLICYHHWNSKIHTHPLYGKFLKGNGLSKKKLKKKKFFSECPARVAGDIKVGKKNWCLLFLASVLSLYLSTLINLSLPLLIYAKQRKCLFSSLTPPPNRVLFLWIKAC